MTAGADRGAPLRLGALVLLALFGCGIVQVARADTFADYLFADEHNLRSVMHTGLPDAPARYWLEEPEFRFVPDRNTQDISTETYRLRFRPTSRRERRADQSMYQVEDKLVAARWRNTLNRQLAGRYHRLLELIEQQLQLHALDAQLQLDRDQLAAEQRLTATRDFSATRLRSTTLRMARHRQELTLQQARVHALRQATGLTGSAGELDDPQLARHILQPDHVEQLLGDIPTDAARAAPTSVIAHLAAERAEHALAEEQARSGFGLSLFELGYQDDRVQSYTMTFGFRIPIANRRHTSARLQRELFEARQQAELAARTDAEEIRYAALELTLQIDAYREYARALAALRADAANASTDAAGYAALREQALELQRAMTASHMRLLHGFVDLLELTAQLDRAPLRNWIRRI